MTLQLTKDYAARVYAGVLGKIIGVYLGRPFEGWSYERLVEVFGEVTYFVNQHRHYEKKPGLIVTDDDISGTFTFFRALEDHGYSRDITAEQIGRCWLNYIIENRTILWWGGLGHSTEHTAYLRLKAGIPGPQSGSIALNGPIVAQQIGAQIFIDAWGLCCPGDAALAAKLARAAGQVSHDGEAVHGAVIVACLEALAFVENDLDKMLDGALAQIPADSLIARQIADIRGWVKADGDWHKTFARIKEKYGYDRYIGGCHIIPNHALVIMALLYAPDDFSEALKIVNTCGWDTDCNSANVGCIMGVRVGLAGMQRRHDWRGPVADRMFLPTAEGGRGITDAASEALRIVKAGYALAGQRYTAPKNGARWHFALPGAVQGWLATSDALGRPAAVVSHEAGGLRILVAESHGDQSAGAVVSTFLTPEQMQQGGYGIMATPLVTSGQVVTAQVGGARGAGVEVRLAAEYFGASDLPRRLEGAWKSLAAGAADLVNVAWQIPDTGGYPIFQLRIECRAAGGGPAAALVSSVDVAGTPTARLMPEQPEAPGDLWRRAFIDAVTRQHKSDRGWSITQDAGVGVLATGSEHWSNYRVSGRVEVRLADSFGLVAAYRGLRRQVRFTLGRDGQARLTRQELDGTHELGHADFTFELDKNYELALEWTGESIRGFVDGKLVVEAAGLKGMPTGGGVGIIIGVGRILVSELAIKALCAERRDGTKTEDLL